MYFEDQCMQKRAAINRARLKLSDAIPDGFAVRTNHGRSPGGRRPAEDRQFHPLCPALRRFTRLYKPLLDPMGLTYPQYLVMAVLWEKDGRTVGEIGEKLLLESSTLTPCSSAGAAGMVRRTRIRVDERVVRIQLTPKGAALKQKALEIPGHRLR
jgi:DNA-binding MarR family transcriptional regulator